MSELPPKHEIVYQSEFIPIEVNSDCVVIELMKYSDYFQPNHPKTKKISLDPYKIMRLKIFLSHLIHKTDKIVFFLPENCDLTDFVEIFDDILFDEEMQ